MSQPSTNLHVTFDEWNQDYYLQTADRVTVGIAYGSNDAGDAPGSENARLWSASPLLLEHLTWAVQWIEGWEGETMPEWREWAAKARHAINIATES
jgi:hypothetical protein